MAENETWTASASFTKLAAALVAAQAEIGAATKDAENPHFRSKYADLAAVLAAVRGACAKNNIALLQPASTIGNDALVTTMLVHASGEYLSSTLRIPATKGDAQGLGSAISYGRRYGLQSVLCVPVADDDGNQAVEPRPNPQEPRYAMQDATAAPASPASPATASGGGAFVVPFGKNKGKTVDSIPREDAEWLCNVMLESVHDPNKARFRAQNASNHAAIAAFLGHSTDTADIPF